MSLHVVRSACLAMLFALGLIATAGTVRGAEPASAFREYTDNQNSLVAEYRDKLVLVASSYWSGYQPGRAFDGDPYRSWFTARHDTVTKGKQPWISVTFPQDVTIRRVTILTNREPTWINGFSIVVGRVELLRQDGEVIAVKDDELGDKRLDLDFRFDGVSGVRTVRFTALKDEGDQNVYEDVAVGEVLVE